MEEKFTSNIKAELELVQGLKERRLPAFVDFYDRYGPALYGTIKRSVLNEDVAKEKLVDTFRIIWLSIDTFNPSKDHLFTWAAKIATKEINKQKIELTVKQFFSIEHKDVII